MTTQPRPSDLVRDVFPDSPQGGDLADAAAPAPSMRASVEDVEEAMRYVVDLGLLYGVHLDEDNNCTLDMTLTSPTCPLTDRIEYDSMAALEGLVNSVIINWVWLPPWTMDAITDDGREQLRAIGYNL